MRQFAKGGCQFRVGQGFARQTVQFLRIKAGLFAEGGCTTRDKHLGSGIGLKFFEQGRTLFHFARLHDRAALVYMDKLQTNFLISTILPVKFCLTTACLAVRFLSCPILLSLSHNIITKGHGGTLTIPLNPS